MASFRKVDGKWRADVHANGKRKAKSFITKGEAQRWAREIEQEFSGRDDLVGGDFVC